MKSKMHVPVVMFLLGAGVAMVGSYLAIVGAGMKLISSGSATQTDSTWQTVDISGVATVEIPSTCTIDPGAGNHYVVCSDAPDAKPEMDLSSDGYTLIVSKTLGYDSPYWEHVVGSIKVNQPLTHDVTIRIQQ